MSNEIRRLFQGLGCIQGTNNCFSSTGTKSPKAPRSHIASLYAKLSPWRNILVECDSKWEETNLNLTDQSPHQHPTSKHPKFTGTSWYRTQAPITSWSKSRTFNSKTQWQSMHITIFPSGWSLKISFINTTPWIIKSMALSMLERGREYMG